MHTKGIWFAFSRFLPLDPSYFSKLGPVPVHATHQVCISRQMAWLDFSLDACACVSAAGWVNGGHLGLARASVNGAGERHSALWTAPWC